jgi:hypothetical protein
MNQVFAWQLDRHRNASIGFTGKPAAASFDHLIGAASA